MTYFFIGLLLYPLAMDMYLRVQAKRNRPIQMLKPDPLRFYFGFALFTSVWPVAYPVLVYNFIKEMKKCSS